MKTIYLPPVLIVLGMVLLVLGFAWPYVVGPGAEWGEAEARAHRDAAAQLNRLVHEYDRPPPLNPKRPPEEIAAAVEAAEQRYEQIDARRRAARDRPLRRARLLKYTGGGCLVVGVGFYLLTRSLFD